MKKIMYAKKEYDEYENKYFFNSIHNDIFMTKMYPDGYDKKIYKIKVTIHPNQVPKNKHSNFGIEYWGWIETGSDKFEMIQPSYIQFKMCFAYGYKVNEKKGEGKAYKLNVKEIGIVKK